MSQSASFVTLCRMLVILLVLTAPSSLAQRGTITPSRHIDDIKTEVEDKLDLGNAYIADAAITIAADYPGEYSINQISQIYNIMAQGGWYYINDPSGWESYQNANLSLQKGKIKNTIGMGDCDDFAILMTSLIQSIGGSARIIFAYDGSNNSGHAYSEIYLGENGTSEVSEIISWIKREYNVEDLPGINRTGDEIWLNLDWGSDITKAAYPGGPYFGEGSKNIRSEIIWQADGRAPPTIVPVIEDMNSLEGWKTIADGSGSFINISAIPGKKENVSMLQVSYNLKEGGSVRIFKEIDSDILSGIAGLNFSYFGIGNRNTIGLRLVYDDGTTYGSLGSKTKAEIWSYQRMLFSKIECLRPENNCRSQKGFNLSKVRRLEFIITNTPEEGDASGSGAVIIDKIWGIMSIPSGSPWARMEERNQKALALDLASKSEQILDQNTNLITSGVFLSIESMRRYLTPEGYQALIRGSSLLLKPADIIKIDYPMISPAIFSPDGRYMAIVGELDTKIIDIRTHRPIIEESVNGYQKESVQFSPDSKYVAMSLRSGKAALINLSSRQVEANIQYDITENEEAIVYNVNSVEFSPDSKYMATTGTNGNAVLWDIEKRIVSANISIDGYYNTNSAEFSPDSKYLATISNNMTIDLLNLISLQSIKIPVKYSSAFMKFSQNGNYLAIAPLEIRNNVTLIDVAKGLAVAYVSHEGLSQPGPSGLSSLEFRPDSKYLATGNLDGTVKLLELEKQPQIIVPMPDKEEVTYIEFSPDSKYLAIATGYFVKLLDMERRQIAATISNSGYLEAIKFSNDGRYLATASRDGSAKLFITECNQLLATISHKGWVNNVDFSPDNKYLATASRDGTAKLWDIENNKMSAIVSHDLAIIEKNHMSPIQSDDLEFFDVKFSPDGQYLAATSKDGTIRLLSLYPPLSVTIPGDGSVEYVNFNDVDFSPESRYLLAASRKNYGYNETVKLLDLETGQVANMPESVKDAKFRKMSRGQLAISYNNGSVTIMDLPTHNVINAMRYNESYHMDFSPEGKYLAIADNNYGVKLFDMETLHNATIPFNDSIRFLVFSPDSRYLAIADYFNFTKLFDIKTNLQTIITHNGPIDDLSFSGDSRYLAITYRTTAKLFDAKARQTIAAVDLADYIGFVRFIPNSTYLAILGKDSKDSLLDIESNQSIPMQSNKGNVISVDPSPNGKYLAISTSDGLILLKDMEKGVITEISPNNLSVSYYEFSSDSKYLAMASYSGTTALFDMETFNIEATVPQNSHDSTTYIETYPIAFSPDSKYLVTIGKDGTEKLLNTATRQLVAAIPHQGQVKYCMFSPDGRYLALIMVDGTVEVRLWKPEDLIHDACSKSIGNLTEKEWERYLPGEPYRRTCECEECN